MKWLSATVTYSGGASYQILGYKFLPNRPKIIESKRVADALRGMNEFVILDKFETPQVVAVPEPPQEKKPEQKSSKDKKATMPKSPRKKTIKGWTK